MPDRPEKNLQESERDELPSEAEDSAAENGVAPTGDDVAAGVSPEQTLRNEVEEWRDKFLRKAAELENFRKRMRQDYESMSSAVRQALILEFLPILDDFDRLLSSSQPSDAQGLRDGAQLIRDKLSRVFASLGIEKIDAEGKPFDHDEHDAVLTIESPDHPPHVVVSVVQPGYKMNGRVIRHAQVAVSKEPEETPPESDDES
jgi:molecular chaperone GrpE